MTAHAATEPNIQQKWSTLQWFLSAFVVFYAIKTTYDCAATYASTSTYANMVCTLVNDGEIPEQFVCGLGFISWNSLHESMPLN